MQREADSRILPLIMSNDPVLASLAERRRKAQKLIDRGTAIVQKGKAEMAECDRFEEFYRTATFKVVASSAVERPQRHLDLDLADLVTKSFPNGARDALYTEITKQMTLKQAILNVLRAHPEGLNSSEMLDALRSNGFPNLLRTSMSPQLSRLKGTALENVEGKWVLKNKEAAAPSGDSGVFE